MGNNFLDFGGPQNMAAALGKQPQLKSSEKITRDAFLYLEPKGIEDKEQFAQCGTCLHRFGTDRCALMGDTKIQFKDGTCAMYAEGMPKFFVPFADYSKEEIGYTERQVRCENCKYGGSNCQLYTALNKAFPQAFDLDTKIDEYGCCNGNSPK